jgi:hypothetical protein
MFDESGYIMPTTRQLVHHFPHFNADLLGSG